MIVTTGLSPKFLKKEAYFGSHAGMRYTLKFDGEKIIVYVYPEPWCLEATPEEDLIRHESAFSQDGVDEAIQWLNDTYNAERERWDHADKNKMSFFLK